MCVGKSIGPAATGPAGPVPPALWDCVKVTVSNIFKISLVWALWHTTATSTDSLLCTSMEEELFEEHSEPVIGVASDGTEEPQEADTQKDKNHWHRRGLIRRRVVGYGGCLR